MSEDTSNGGGYDVVRAQWRGRLVPGCQVLRGGEGQKSRNGRVNELDGALESGGEGGFIVPSIPTRVEFYESWSPLHG